MADRDRVYRREDIVYYHELDNNNEAIQNQDWDGHNQAVVSDIVVSGMAPVPVSSFSSSFETPFIAFNDGRNDNMFLRTRKLSDDKVMMIYRRTDEGGVAVVGDVAETSSGCTVNWGTPVLWSPAVEEIGLAILSSGKAVAVGWDKDIDNRIRAWVLNVSGTTITVSSSGNSDIPSDRINACEIYESGFAVQYNNIAGGSSIRHRVIAAAIDASDNIVWNTAFVQIGNTRGARNTPTSTNMGYDARRRSNKVLFSFVQDNDDRPDLAIVEYKGISGIFTTGFTAEVDVDTSSTGGDINSTMLTSNIGVTSYYRDASLSLVVRPFLVSGIDIAYVGDAVVYESDAQDFEQNGNSVIRLSANQFIVGYDTELANEVNSTSGSVSGTTSGDLSINLLGAQNILPTSGGLTARQVEGVALDSTRVLWTIGEDADNDIWSTCGSTIIASELTAGGGGGGGSYPNIDGSTNIGVGFWSSNPTINDSTLNVNVGQNITLIGDTITLNNDVSWDITSLDLNDGDTHLTLLEFVNTSGDAWELNVSLDGSGFTSLGEGSGTTSNTVSGTVGPGVSYTTSNPSGTPSSGQYVDELLIWANATGMIFDDEVAANMFSLGQANIPQGQYANFFGSGVSNNLDLYTLGKSGSGCLLQGDKVIYYHPLDDLFEATEGVFWEGSGTFVPGQIGDANSAIATTFEWGTEQTIDTDLAFSVDVANVPNTNKVVVAYRNAIGTTAGSGVLRVGEYSGINNTDPASITWGSAIPFHEPGATEITVNEMPDQSGKVLLSFRDPFNNQDGAFVVEVSGLTVTSGARSLFKSTNHSNSQVAVGGSASGADTMTFWASWQEGGTGEGRGRVGVIDLITSGITYTAESGWVGGTIQATNNRILYGGDNTYVSLYTGAGSRQIRVGRLDEPARDTISWGSGVDPVVIDPASVDENSFDLLSSGNKGVFTYIYDTGAPSGRLAFSRMFSYDKSTLSLSISPPEFIAQGTSDEPLIGPILLTVLEDDKNIVGHKGNRTTVGVIDEPNNSITWGTVQDGPNPNSNETVDQVNIIRPLSIDEGIMVYGRGGDNRLSYSFGISNFSADITSDFPYPTGNGSEAIALAFWALNGTKASSEFAFTRDFTITIDDSSISLGSTSWPFSAYNSKASPPPVFVVLFMEHVGAGQWSLRFSLDGEPFSTPITSSGTQLPGSFGSNDARLQIDNPSGINIWLDETILWAGDSSFAPFEDEEVENLWLLGKNGITMDQYCVTDFDALRGEEQEGTGEFTTLENLLKNANYKPQIIGKFNGASSSATIQVWNIIDGQNTLLTLKSDACYAIGNTGRFGWNTDNLPPIPARVNQYFYRMTNDLAETFDGQFVLNCAEFRAEHRLRGRRR